MSPLERRLLNDFQRDFPLEPEPFATIAASVGITEQELIQTLERLEKHGYLSRIGAVFAPHKVGYSLLAALAVPATRVEEVATLINEYPQVNHNYEREHGYNLWFVLTGEDPQAIERTVVEIEQRIGLDVLRLPLEQAYHIDLAFDLWN